LRPTLIIVLGLAIFIVTTPVVAAGQAPSVALPSVIGFSVTASPDMMTVQTGGNAIVTVTVSSQDLNGPVSLTALVSPSPGPRALVDPSTVIALPGGSATSTLQIDATSTQPGMYGIVVSGSTLLAPSQSVTVTVNITKVPSNPSTTPRTGSNPSGPSGPNGQQPSTTTSGSNPKGPVAPKSQGPQSIFDPVGVLVAGNLLAAVATVATMASLKRKRNDSSPSTSQ